MSRFFASTLNEVLKVKGITIVDYFSSLSQKDQKRFWQSHKDVLKTRNYFEEFVKSDFAIISPFIQNDPDGFETLLLRHGIKVKIHTVAPNGWSSTIRNRILFDFHYKHPQRIDFCTGADVKAWLDGSTSRAWLRWENFKHVLEHVIPNFSKNPASAFGAHIRRALKLNYLVHFEESDFELLYSDGDTLLNELFGPENFKAYIEKDCYPKEEFVNILDLNCTLSALEKGRTSRHSTRVAKNLKRAKLLLEIKNV
jgi:hypothetical protein